LLVWPTVSLSVHGEVEAMRAFAVPDFRVGAFVRPVECVGRQSESGGIAAAQARSQHLPLMAGELQLARRQEQVQAQPGGDDLVPPARGRRKVQHTSHRPSR
jgi:hypothetical protein